MSAIPSGSEATPRRDMLKQLAGVAAAAAGLAAVEACAPAASATTTSPSPTRGGGDWDMSWVDRVQKSKRMAFDTNQILEGNALSFVAAYLDGARQAYGSTKDVATVLVLRHSSVPIALGDDIWARMTWGETQKLKDPTTGEITKRNPFINFKTGDRFSPVGETATLDRLIANGTIVLACNVAFTGVTAQLANREKITRDEARKQALASMVPGVILVPNGIFGVGAAQDAGCGCIVVRT